MKSLSLQAAGVVLVLAISVPLALALPILKQDFTSGTEGEFLWESLLIKQGRVPYHSNPVATSGAAMNFYPPVFAAALAPFMDRSPTDLRKARVLATLPLLLSLGIICGYVRNQRRTQTQSWMLLIPALYVVAITSYAQPWALRPNHLWLCLGIGVLCAVQAFVDRVKWRWLFAAILLSVLCCYTKQQGVAFVAAAGSYLLLQGRWCADSHQRSVFLRAAGIYLAAVAALGLSILALLSRLSDGGFLFWMIEIPRLAEYRIYQLPMFFIFLIPFAPLFLLHAWWLSSRRRVDPFQLSLLFGLPVAILAFIKEGGGSHDIEVFLPGLIVPLGTLWEAATHGPPQPRRPTPLRIFLSLLFVGAPAAALFSAYRLSSDGQLNAHAWLSLGLIVLFALTASGCVLGWTSVRQVGPAIMIAVAVVSILSTASSSNEVARTAPHVIAFVEEARSRPDRCCLSRFPASCPGIDLYVHKQDPVLPSLNNLIEYWIARKSLARERVDISSFVSERCESILFGRKADVDDASFFVPGLADPLQWSVVPIDRDFYVATKGAASKAAADARSR